jgi:hypothetical protein
MSFGDWPTADRNGRTLDLNRGGNTVPVIDSAIAYYLCGIMVALGLIIVVGAARQQFNKNK